MSLFQFIFWKVLSLFKFVLISSEQLFLFIWVMSFFYGSFLSYSLIREKFSKSLVSWRLTFLTIDKQHYIGKYETYSLSSVYKGGTHLF